jgi:hypothetical protein
VRTGHAALLVCLALGLSFSGCKDDEEDPSAEEEKPGEGDPCDPENTEEGEDPCAEGLGCEELEDGEGSVCAWPLELRGQVIDALSEEGIDGAHVMAFDRTSAPVSDVAVTEGGGFYSLSVPAPRNEDGSVADGVIFTLGASADDYQFYPGGVRPAFPVDASEIQTEEIEVEGSDTGDTGGETANVDYVENASTTVALIPLEDTAGRTISGSVVGGDGGGALVVAEGASDPAIYAIADLSGNYTLFNVPDAAGTLVGYRAGLAVTPEEISAGSDDLTIDLNVGEDALALVSGSINIVDPGGADGTSVVLVPASVFHPALERGAVPFGLRAPGPGNAPDITGAFEIADVPPGTYKVLAAFENDGLVRDPDLSIAGTELVEITVAGEDLAVETGFKVTGALEVFSPGADGPEVVSGTPSFSWEDDSSEDGYDLVVFDARGAVVWSRDDVPGVSGSSSVDVDYEGPALEDGMYYQFRAISWSDGPQGLERKSATEDLRGVFVYSGGG